jgi:hypothetical protein
VFALIDLVKTWLLPPAEIRGWTFYVRGLWVVIQLVAAYCLAKQVSPFFYQRF